MRRVRVLGAGLILLGSGARAAAEPLAQPGDPAWRAITFPSIEQHTQWEVTRVDGEPAFRAISRCGASGFGLAIEPPLELPGAAAGSDPPTLERIYLRWRWRVDVPLPPGADERSRPGDDFAARVSALFAFDPERSSLWERTQRRVFRAVYDTDLPGRSLSYVWARSLDRGNTWSSPYGGHTQLVALRGPRDEGWQEERVDLLADHLQHFGEAPTALAGIAVMTDTDNGCTRAEALYTGFALERSGRQPPAEGNGSAGVPAEPPRAGRN